MTPIVFVDTETDGLAPHRRAWEIALIRRDDDGERERTFFVQLDLRHSDLQALNVGGFYTRHPHGRRLAGLSASPAAPALASIAAAREVAAYTHGAHLVGVNPAFDAHTLETLLRGCLLIPAWDYHLIDVPAMALGRLMESPPYRSDELAERCGVEPPPPGERHTALGDARWAARWYDELLSGRVVPPVVGRARPRDHHGTPTT